MQIEHQNLAHLKKSVHKIIQDLSSTTNFNKGFIMKKLLLLCLLSGLSLANMEFTKNKECSSCHPNIYKEYMKSQHANSTIFKDPIHGAVYEPHPQHTKKEKYRCGKCHTPTADNLKELLTPNNGITPDAKNETQSEAVACAYCHRIEDTVSGKAMSKNIISKESKVFFTAKEKPGSSPFHGIKTKKDIFKDGKICMGCHARKANKKGFDVCKTDINQKAPKKNCIECHMHKVDGAPSIMSTTKKHTFHGFPGLHGDLTNLSQYVKLHIAIKEDNRMFGVMIEHNVPHASTLHPLRSAKLEVTIKRGDKITKMLDIVIDNTIGNIKGKSLYPAPPWLATQIIRDTRIQANSKKAYKYEWELKDDDVITARFGYYLVKPKALKKFKLENNKEATEFKVIQEKNFTVKLDSSK